MCLKYLEEARKSVVTVGIDFNQSINRSIKIDFII